MQEPWTWVISDKAYGHVVRCHAEIIATNGNDISTDRIGIIICVGPCASDDIEGMLGAKLEQWSL